MRIVRLGVAFLSLAAFAGGAWAASPPPDTLAQRVAACTACHDDSGRRGADAYYPRIAGKPAGYLYHQLLNFKEGRRFYALMTYQVEHLPDAYLREIAEHFAALERPYVAPLATTVRPEALQRGRLLVHEGDAPAKLPACTECHGRRLTGVVPAIPALVGLPRDYLIAQLNAWRSGVRRAHEPDCMADVARRLAPEDVAAIASWLATQPVLGRAEPVASRKLPLACGSVTDAAVK